MAAISRPTGSPFTSPGLRRPLWMRAISIPYGWQVLICTVFGTFMTLLDSTIVNIALPKISTVFGVSINQAQLVITTYMLALAVIIPATGFLSDTFGTKRLYLITMALFTVGSLLCGLAWDNNSLVAFRIIQGLGGGMMGPLGMTMLFASVPPGQRNTVLGFYGLPLILAPVLGPAVGGYIVDSMDWRFIFTLNVPIGVIGIILGMLMLRESERVRGLRFDWLGFMLSAAGCSALLLGFSDAATDGWTDPGILTRFGIGSICMIAWVVVELKHPQPLLELRLFKSPLFSLSMLVNFVLTAGMFGAQLLLPLFLQSFRGLGAAEAGLITMAQALALLPIMPLVGRMVDRFGSRPLLLIGLPLVALTTWQFAALDLNTSDNQIRLMLAARGLAMGLVMMPAMTTAMNAAPMHLLSRASSLTNVARQVYGAFGTAIFVTLLQSRSTFHSSVLTQTVTPDNIPLQQVLAQAQQWVVSHGGTVVQGQAAGLAMVMRQLQLTSGVQAFDDVFRIAAILTLLALIPALFLRTGRPSSGPGGAPAMLGE